jgi:hypothetical protein
VGWRGRKRKKKKREALIYLEGSLHSQYIHMMNIEE